MSRSAQVLQTVTVWAQPCEVLQGIMSAVVVLVMRLKNAGFGVPVAPCTSFGRHASRIPFAVVSRAREFVALCQASAFVGTENPFADARGGHAKLRLALLAGHLHAPAARLPPVVTLARTVLGYELSQRRHEKLLLTFLANDGPVRGLFLGGTHAFSRAIFEGVDAVGLHANHCIAV